jgi:hypothetical protein
MGRIAVFVMVAVEALILSGCAVTSAVGTVADVAGTVVSTTVGVTGDVIGAAADTVTGSSSKSN